MQCELCAHPAPFLPLYPELGIVRCPGCELVFYQTKSPIDPKAIYGKHYFSGEEYRDYESDHEEFRRNFRERLNDLKKLKPEGGKLLEIGCAYGFFLEEAKSHFRSVRGIDVSKDAIESAKKRGLDVREGDFLSVPADPEGYDAICLWDTIEHLSEPVKTIRKAASELKPGGVLIATTGDFGSLNARLRGKKWRQIHPPSHLYYFTRKTLDHAFNSAGLGFTEFRAIPMIRSFRSMVYGVFGKKAYKALTFGGKLDFPVRLNLGDLVWVSGRKSGGDLGPS